MPGFVDPHTHLCYAGERWEEFATRRSGADYLAVLAAGGGIHATVRATTAASDEELLALLVRRIGDALELGTTTIEVKSGYGLDPEAELRQLPIIASAKATAPRPTAYARSRARRSPWCSFRAARSSLATRRPTPGVSSRRACRSPSRRITTPGRRLWRACRPRSRSA